MERHSNRFASLRARAWLAAVLFLAGCAGAGAQRAGAGAVAAGKFTPAGAQAANYGPDPQRTCPATSIGRYIASDSADEAKKIQKPAPQADGRLCAVAESLLGWDEQQNPPESLLSFLAFHFGIPSGIPRVVLATIDSEDPKDLGARLNEAVMQYVRSTAGQVRYGWATARGARGGTKVSLAMQDPPLELEPLPRKLDPKAEATLSGRLLGPLQNPKVLISDPRGKLQQPESKPGKEFSVPVSCGGRKGRIAVEIRGEEQGQPRIAANFPVFCGIDPPTSAQLPTPGGEVAQQERTIFEQINAERTEAELPPLKWDDKVAQVARSVSENEAKGGGGGSATADLAQRLKAAGIASPVVLVNPGAARTAEDVQRLFSLSPIYRANYMSTDATSAGTGVANGKDPQGGNVAFVTELFVRELGQVDVATVAPKLRETINKKRASAGMPASKDDPVLDKVAQEYAQALAAANGNISDAKHSQIVSPLYKTFRTVDFLSGAKADPAEFADEKTVITSKEKAMGIGVGQGNHPVLGKNATYVVLLFGTRK
ncbi:MAG TPA: CAP domain-containing protein [Myxococcales bacterium]